MWTTWKTYMRTIIGILVFLACATAAYRLLFLDQVSSTAFVTLIIGSMTFALIIVFSSEVQEFSIAGNIVKLREVKKDVEISIAGLKLARTETFRFLLKLSINFSGGFGSSSNPIDTRIANFWFLYQQIVSFESEQELVEDIDSVVKLLLWGQLQCICNFSNFTLAPENSGLDNICKNAPDFLNQLAFDESSIQEKITSRSPPPLMTDMKKNLYISVNEYRKLYELHQALDQKITQTRRDS